MNKELVIHLVIGAAAVGTLYWLWTKNKATTVSSPSGWQAAGQTIQTDTSAGYNWLGEQVDNEVENPGATLLGGLVGTVGTVIP